MNRRAKIVCTIGPASRQPEQLRQLLESGMDVARLNFSHGTHSEHAEVLDTVRKLAAKAGRPVAILQDLQGPKLRLGALRGGSATLTSGNQFVLTAPSEDQGNEHRAAVSYTDLPQDVRPGDPILLQDGLLRLDVEHIQGTDVVCRIIHGGTLRERAGLNLPGTELSTPSLTEKDRADLAFGLEQGVDIVALSFVRRAADMAALREAVTSATESPPLLIAKLEKPQAIDALDSILDIADGVMVARGDLGVEVSPERVPFMQKTIIRQAAAALVPVITATQMLESMISNPRPTRAEASDVANAVFDGTDAVMLSGETSIGAHPVETVNMMDRIVREAEKHLVYPPERRREDSTKSVPGFAAAIAAAAGRAAAEVQATALVAFTQSGFTGRLISKSRPETRLIAYTPDDSVLRQLALYWGAVPRKAPVLDDIEKMIAWADRDLRHAGLVRPGDNLVFVAGVPSNERGITNMLRLHRVGDFPA